MSAAEAGFTLRLPFDQGPPLTMNQLRSRTHWAVQRRAHDDVSDAVVVLCRKHKIKPVETLAVVKLTWHAKGKGRRDPDSLGAMIKGCLDGLTTARILDDDSAKYVDHVELKVVIAAADPRVELTVEPV